jgi:hypothetical protein
MPGILSTDPKHHRWRFDECDIVRDLRHDDDLDRPILGIITQIFVDVGDMTRLMMVRVMWSTGQTETLVGDAIDNALVRATAACKVSVGGV